MMIGIQIKIECTLQPPHAKASVGERRGDDKIRKGGIVLHTHLDDFAFFPPLFSFSS